jgi:hypothetical protein
MPNTISVASEKKWQQVTAMRGISPIRLRRCGVSLTPFAAVLLATLSAPVLTYAVQMSLIVIIKTRIILEF